MSHIFVEPVLKNTWSLWASNLDPRPVSQLNLKPRVPVVSGTAFRDLLAIGIMLGHVAQDLTPSCLQVCLQLKRRRFGDTHDERYGFTH